MALVTMGTGRDIKLTDNIARHMTITMTTRANAKLKTKKSTTAKNIHNTDNVINMS